jgi:hypothetical protein
MIGVAMELGIANPVPALNCLVQPSIAGAGEQAQVARWADAKGAAIVATEGGKIDIAAV